LENGYAVARYLAKQPAGLPKLKDIQGDIRQKMINERKASLLAAQINQSLGKKTPLKHILLAHAKNFVHYQFRNISFQQTELNGLGYVPEVIGAAFALQKSERSTVIYGPNGLYIVECLRKRNPDHQLLGFQAYYAEALKKARAIAMYGFWLLIKDKATISDYRYRFYS
jgi:peptidylprolyl isomerase/peptidyl-prolyl cis-trans isomerase D